MKVTFTEIAKLAGVSVPTVSRYFNQQTVSPQNQLKIAQAAKALHYKPNKAGSKTVLVLLPTVTNPLYAEFYEAVQGNLAQLGYDCQLHVGQDDNFLASLKSNNFSGLITSLPETPLSLTRQLPTVSFDRPISWEIPLVSCENYGGGHLIAQTVLKRGAKEILILCGSQQDLSPINERLRGMMDCFQKRQTKFSTAYLDFTAGNLFKQVQLAKLLTGQKYDAICCSDDITALLVKQRVRQLSYQPLVTGFDGSNFVRNFFPDLLTVKQPIKDLAALTCQLLDQRLRRGHFPSGHKQELPVTLLDL